VVFPGSGDPTKRRAELYRRASSAQPGSINPTSANDREAALGSQLVELVLHHVTHMHIDLINVMVLTEFGNDVALDWLEPVQFGTFYRSVSQPAKSIYLRAYAFARALRAVRLPVTTPARDGKPAIQDVRLHDLRHSAAGAYRWCRYRAGWVARNRRSRSTCTRLGAGNRRKPVTGAAGAKCPCPDATSR
jgi:hypothetical protein